jgi:hypothetical protein
MSLDEQQLKYTKIGALAGVASVVLGLLAWAGQEAPASVSENPKIETNYYITPAAPDRGVQARPVDSAKTATSAPESARDPEPSPGTPMEAGAGSSAAETPRTVPAPVAQSTRPVVRRYDRRNSDDSAHLQARAQPSPEIQEPQRPPALEFTHVAR